MSRNRDIERLRGLERLLLEYEKEYYLIRTSPKGSFSEKRFYEVSFFIDYIKEEIKNLKKDTGFDRLMFEICRN